jgi:uncharacterized protein YdaU (DUF1376 family)
MKIHTIQLNIGDLIGGTNSMDAAEFGAYMHLVICCYQDKAHEIPKEDSRLALMARCTPKLWARVKEKVIHKFIPTENGWTHERVQKDATKYKLKSAVNKANALKRWEEQMRMANETQCERNATQDPRPKTQESKPLLPSVTSAQGGDFKPSVSGRIFSIERKLSDAGRERAKLLCKSLNRDIYPLFEIYDKGINEGGREPPKAPDAAFYAWIGKYTKGQTL